MSDEESTAPPATFSDGKALAALQKQSIELLGENFGKFLEKLIDHLFDLSSRAQQSMSGYNIYYEAMNSVKKNKGMVSDSLINELSELYQDLTPKDDDSTLEPDQDKEDDTLNLVDIEEFEDHLQIDKIISTGSARHSVPLECLTIRLAELAAADPCDIRLPVHVKQISRALPRALQGQDIPKEVIPKILDFFLEAFIEKLGGYYDKLNLALREAGIRRDLEKEIDSKGSLLNRAASFTRQPKPKTPTRDTGNSPGESAPAAVDDGFSGHLQQQLRQHLQQQPPSQAPQQSQPPAAPPQNMDTNNPGASSRQLSPDSLYNSVITALNFKREADALISGGTPGGVATADRTGAAASAPTSAAGHQAPADAPSIANALASLQRSAEARTAVQQSASLRDYLTANQHQIGELSGNTGLTPESINQLDLVDNLFGTIKAEVDVTKELKPALGNLQIPLAKLALLEPRFFVDQDHPARGVVDKLAQLAASANFPNKALESRIERIVDKIVDDYDNDSIVFETALGTVDKLVTQQQRAQERNLERVVKTQEGQEKLIKAHAAVIDIINARITFPEAPEVLIQLVDSGWRDLLVLTYIREGADSDSWREHVKTLDLLSLWLSEQIEDEVDEDMHVQRSLEAESLIDMISQQISTALPTNIAHEAVLDDLRGIFAGRKAIKMAQVAPPSEDEEPKPAEVKAKIESLPRIRRWVQRVNQLEKGTWLNYKDKEGQSRRMQLAWISDNKDRYIFVNERGQRHAELSAVQLARQLSRGVRPPTPADKLSLVDQSMYGTLEHVQKSLSFTRNHDSLTKLINRDTFLGQVGRALRHAQGKQSQHAVLCLNIDQFSLVNDVYDELTGDLVLLEFAKLLSQVHGKKSSSCRIENDEFSVLLLDRTIEQAVQYANQIRADIQSSSVEIEDQKVTFTVSIGVAPIRDYSPGVEDIMQFAHSAMRLAKDRGRNQVVEYEEDQADIDRYRQNHQEARSRVQQSLETSRFVLRAQPIVKTAVDGSAPASEHFELLLGLKNKDASISSPQEFIQSAEKYGYMALVDRWVVKESFNWINTLMDSQKIVPNLSINLSGSSITNDSFMDYLLEQISEFGVGTSKLCFEITETGTISNLVKAADFVRAFRNIGCKFSIDDFGTGLASHNYLRELPVDFVKIDGTFITEIDNNRNDYAMTRSINDLAHFLGQKTIAESVENGDIIKKLTEIGVDYLQGWGVGKPKLLDEVAEGLANIEK